MQSLFITVARLGKNRLFLVCRYQNLLWHELNRPRSRPFQVAACRLHGLGRFGTRTISLWKTGKGDLDVVVLGKFVRALPIIFMPVVLRYL